MEADRMPLAQQVHSLDQLTSMEMDELRRLSGLHDEEIVSLVGRIESSRDTAWVRSARQALRYLRLHKTWISAEISRREKAERLAVDKAAAFSRSDARVRVQEEMTKRQREAEQARIDRIRAANEETSRQLAAFKEVARQTLSEETYSRLWELTRMRLAETGSASEDSANA